MKLAFLCFWYFASPYRLPDEFLCEDANFRVRAALAECDDKKAKCLSFECVNFPNHFLKYSDGDIVVEELDESPHDNIAATWLIDDGKLRKLNGLGFKSIILFHCSRRRTAVKLFSYQISGHFEIA